MADHIRKPTEAEQKILEKAMKAARKQRDKAVNRTKKPSSGRASPTTPGSNIPNLRRTRKDIMKELT